MNRNKFFKMKPDRMMTKNDANKSLIDNDKNRIAGELTFVFVCKRTTKKTHHVRNVCEEETKGFQS